MAFLRAFGRYVPARVVDNAELAARLDCDADWIRSVSGIAERRWAAASETVVDMAERAARDCISHAGIDASAIGMVIVAGGSSPRRFPGPAAETAARLGLAGIPAIDVPMASAGALFGLVQAAQFSRDSGPVLVVAAEKMSTVIEGAPLDRNTAILFGDGAGAALVDPRRGLAEIAGWALHSDGSFAEALRLEYGEPLAMDGRTVILQASRKIPAVIREVLQKRPAADVTAFVMHQANQNLIVKCAQALEVPPEKFYSNIARYGNTSSASMLIAASEWSEGRKWQPGEPVVFAVFGAGFHWGAIFAIGSCQ